MPENRLKSRASMANYITCEFFLRADHGTSCPLIYQLFQIPTAGHQPMTIECLSGGFD
jgi:hypothetical protein